MSSVADSFLVNLKLLGFDPQVYATGIFFNIRFANDMFTRNADNNKAFEITSHFLFSKLDPVQTKKTFRDCWPITDYKRHSREYRAAAYRWLEQLKRDNYLLGPVVLRRSYFEDCRGEHMNTIMLAFSTHVLQRTIDREIAADSSLSSGMDEIPMRISHIPHVNSLEDASNSLQDLLGSYASTLTSQVSKMNKYHEQWDKSAKLIANNLKSQSDRDKSDDLEKDQDYSSVESTPLPQVDIQIIRDRLRNILDTLRAKNEDLADAVSSNPVIVTRANHYKEQWDSLYSRLREHLPETNNHNHDNQPRFILPEITKVPDEAEDIELVRQNVSDIVSSEIREQELKKVAKNASPVSVQGKHSVMDTTPNPFATKNNTPLHPRETTPELYPENEAIYKTPEKQQSRLGLNSLDWDHYKNTPGHYQKSQDDISPFSSNLSPIHAAIATHVIENFQRQRTPIHKEQSPSPYREWHRSNPHSFEHGQGRQPVDQLETEKPSQSVNSIQKVQSPYREWHKRRRRSFEHRTIRPPDASILEQDSPTYIQAAQQFSQHSNMDFINESPSQRVGQKRMNTQHMDSPTRDHSSDSLKAYHEKALLEAKSRSQQEFIQRDNGWGGLFTELNETSVNQTRYHPIHESSPTNPDRQHSVPLLERTPVHQMSSRGSYSFAEEDAPDIFGESQPSQFYHSD